MIKKFLRDETGLELSEYAVAAALVALDVLLQPGLVHARVPRGERLGQNRRRGGCTPDKTDRATIAEGEARQPSCSGTGTTCASSSATPNPSL